MNISLLGSWLDKIINFILGFFAFIPQVMYFLYASIASLLDVLQFLIRKLAGLDVYYVNGVQQSGDIITELLKGIVGINKDPTYSTIATVFWSFVIFGVILLILTTIVSIIKAHYNYDQNKSHPLKIFYGSLKSLALMAIVPIVTIFGIYLAQILLQTLDRVTTSGSSGAIESVFEEVQVGQDDNGNPIMSSVARENFVSGVDATGYETYVRYDYFSFGDYTSTATFSGMLFNIAGYSCNRVRLDEFRVQNSPSADAWDTMGVFYVSSESENAKEVLAKQIDYAFANNLKLKNSKTILVAGDDASVLGPSFAFGFSATVGAQLINVGSFSKFNVGAVFYYYNLWAFNYLLGFAGVILCALMLGNIVFGLMARLLQVVALFIVSPALVGIMPIDDGSAFGSWRKQFMSDILMAFGAIVGLNIFFLLLPFFQSISFFNNDFIDIIINMIIVLAGLSLVKKFISIVSKFVGGGDANETGSAVREDVKNSAIKGLVGTAAAGALGVATFTPQFAAMKMGAKGVGKGVGKVAGKIAKTKGVQKAVQKRQDNKIRKTLGLNKDTAIDRGHRKEYEAYNSLDRKSKKNVKEMLKTTDASGRTLSERLSAGGLASGSAHNALQNGILKTEAQETQKRKVDKNNKKVEGRYKRAKVVSMLTGQDPDKVKKGAVDAQGNITDEGSGGGLKAFGTAFVDFSQVAIKTMGQLTGASSAWKQLGDAGAVDHGKSALKRAANAGGFKTLANSKMLATKKEKDDKEAGELKEMRAAQQAALKEMQSNTEATTQAVKEIVRLLSSRPGGGGTSGGGGGGTP